MKNNKRTLLTALMALLLAALLLCGTACGVDTDTEQPNTSAIVTTGTPEKSAEEKTWESALYRENTSFGTGANTVYVVVKYHTYSVTFTIKTDREMLGDALIDHNLVAGEEGAYGLYVKTVNGILADYDIDQSYWSIQQNGEALMTGVDSTPVVDGATYELVYTK